MFLVVRGWYALRSKSITVKKPIGFPWQFKEIQREDSPRMFLITAWGVIILGMFFVLFPFFVDYFI